MKTDELRESYLSFFESKNCLRRPSDVLVPKNDKTVLFTPAGMNQFKEQFLGLGNLEFTTATTCQKCLRTGDISNVGVTAYHHTFFEMLGNFSFGDYFKREAIHWAWEYLTDKKWLALDPSRLSVTVYLEDDEAYNIWKNEIGLSAKQIRRDNEDENFWPAGAPTQGPDGVCGPCSEIFYHPPTGGGEVEIWNLVFTQFNRVGNPPNNLQPLPSKNIDTGMGLERTAAVLQGVESNFEIDSLKPLCLTAAEIVEEKYQFSAPNGRPIRRIADHVRAVTMCLHEGTEPSNEKEGYIVRQLLRRASLEGYLLGKQEPFLHLLVPSVVSMLSQPYPEIAKTVDSVANSIRAEESQFLETIDRGLHQFESLVEKAKSSGASTISGDDAFNLHQQEGFLIELTESMAARHNLAIDLKQFQKRMNEHKQTSGRGNFADAVMAEGPLDAIRKTSGGTISLAYETENTNAKIVGIIAEGQLVESITEVGHESPIAILLDQSSFYGEAGGQVGDTGLLSNADIEFQVRETLRDGELLLHVGHLTKGTLSIDEVVAVQVDTTRRAGIQRAHSATHILHHALHSIIGEKATQRGSKVENDALRFDFAHGSALSKEEVVQVENIINQRIAEGAAVSTELMKLEKAKELGAMALFGEKYPDSVRVVTMGDFSVELCGGTHLTNTGQVGFCKIVSEEPVAKGVRRISALTGRRALQYVRQTEATLNQLVAQLKTPADELPKRVEALQKELRELKQTLAKQATQSMAGLADELIEQAEEVGGVKIVSTLMQDVPREALRELIDQIRGKVTPVVIVVGAVIDGKVALSSGISKELIKQGIKASDCIKIAAKVVGGGGGGRPDLAEAGGKLPEKLPEAIQAGVVFYQEKLSE
ncbi:Alanyl-tRNA synthetase [hydrothermal vent metagenome]|uniref:Alanine--tRNA ligase n=1 Tax=hydrothermal vent metagenome TaxID=652676 RepID=A0A3B1DL65_9ZZZZ